MWSNDIKCKYMFIFPLKNSARKELIHIHSPLNVNGHLHMSIALYHVPAVCFALLLVLFLVYYSCLLSTHMFWHWHWSSRNGRLCCCLDIIQVINNPLTPPVTNNYSCIFIPELSFAIRSHYIIIIMPGPPFFHILTMALLPAWATYVRHVVNT